MKFKKTRIAFSSLCGIFCLLLIALWASSYCWSEVFLSNRWDPIVVISGGDLVYDADYTYLLRPYAQKSHEIQISDYWYKIQHVWNADGRGLTVHKYRMRVPIWPFIIGVLLIAMVPCLSVLPRRFSLRTLLIATTAVAVSLWFIVWMAQR